MSAPPPTRARAGLLLPGLGHLLLGEWIEGIGLLALTAELLLAGSGLPSILPKLHLPGNGAFALHPFLALLTLALGAVGLWSVAWGRLQPRPLIPRGLGRLKRELRRSRSGMIGLYLALLIVGLGLLGPLLAPFDPLAIDVGPQLAPPDWVHWLGTDRYGRDLWSRVLGGARVSLTIGVVAVAISATLGTTVGAVSGYLGGGVDRGIMWVTDMLSSLPQLVVLLAIAGMLRLQAEAGIFAIVAILGLTGWMGVARIVRSQVLSLREQDFVVASRALGLPTSRIILRHIVPNAFSQVIVHASLAIGATILAEASLSFLGIGVSAPTPTWGNIIRDGKEYLRAAWWISLFPGLMIAVAVMSFNLLGDGLRDALDPKLRGRG